LKIKIPDIKKVQNFLNSTYMGKWALVGILIGIIAGFGATVFYFSIKLVTDYMLGGITGFIPPNPAGDLSVLPSLNPRYFLIPVSTTLGGLIAGLIIFYFAPEAEGHGTDAAIDAFHNKNGIIRKRIPLVKLVASAVTIGSGGSAGREGPTAQIAAGFGSIIGSILGFSAKDRRIAVATGIGAGIGAIFKSPFGGAILSAEILYSAGDMEVEALIPSFIASPLGYVIFASFTNYEPIFGNSFSYTFNHPMNLIIFAILGLVAGIVGKFYTTTFYWVKDKFSKLKIPKYTRPALGGLLTGIIAMFFPEVTGMGYGYLQYLIDGKLSLIQSEYIILPLALTILIIIFAKIIATSLTIGSGGSGGVFAPSLVIGGFLGALMWIIVHSIFPGIALELSPMVIIGMMAFFAGVGRVPIAVILMVSEMTGSLSAIIPAMVAVVISYYVVGPKYTIYKSQVRTRADSPAHRGEYSIPLLDRIKVREAMTYDPVTIHPSDNIYDALSILNKNRFKALPVVSGKELVGIVTKGDLMNIQMDSYKITPVSKVMTKNVITTSPDESLHEVLKKMSLNEIGRLPVVNGSNDGSKTLIAIITRGDLYRAYERSSGLYENLEN
jgi:CIC family chloride channel protein